MRVIEHILRTVLVEVVCLIAILNIQWFMLPKALPTQAEGFTLLGLLSGYLLSARILFLARKQPEGCEPQSSLLGTLLDETMARPVCHSDHSVHFQGIHEVARGPR
jgi:hypothetical protein